MAKGYHKFTVAQKAVLKSALRTDGVGGRFRYCSPNDPVMRVLNNIGMATYSFATSRYGKASWYITDEGIERAKELYPDDAKAYDEWHAS